MNWVVLNGLLSENKEGQAHLAYLHDIFMAFIIVWYPTLPLCQIGIFVETTNVQLLTNFSSLNHA